MPHSTAPSLSLRKPWMISLHGGHSGQYCDHARGTLDEVIEAAIAAGFVLYGVSEHAPRHGEEYLFPEERAMGWTVDKIIADFERYARDSADLVKRFSDRIEILRGFEIEVVPDDRYIEIMQGYRRDWHFDYIVGSVHFIDGICIDSHLEFFDEALRVHGSLEQLVVRYYATIREMIESMRPEVVGHLDLMRKNGIHRGWRDTAMTRKAATDTLEVVLKHGCILDLNTAGYRKGLGSPYPEAWLVQEAHQAGIPFCFGDDSHGPHDVGAGMAAAREYLLTNGVREITTLTRIDTAMGRRVVTLGHDS